MMYSQPVDGNDVSPRATDDQHNYDNIRQYHLDSSGISSYRDSIDADNSPQLFTPSSSVHQRAFQLDRSAFLRRIEELEKENIRLANRSKTSLVDETKLTNEHAKLKQDFQELKRKFENERDEHAKTAQKLKSAIKARELAEQTIIELQAKNKDKKAIENQKQTKIDRSRSSRSIRLPERVDLLKQIDELENRKERFVCQNIDAEFLNLPSFWASPNALRRSNAENLTWNPNGRTLEITKTDMSETMQNQAAKCTAQAVEWFTNYNDLAKHVQKSFQQSHGPVWSCIVGNDVGWDIAYSPGHYIQFDHGEVAIALFKSVISEVEIESDSNMTTSCSSAAAVRSQQI